MKKYIKVEQKTTTFIGALLEHLFKDFQPSRIIINNEDPKPIRKGFRPGGKMTSVLPRHAIASDEDAEKQDKRNRAKREGGKREREFNGCSTWPQIIMFEYINKFNK